MHKTIYKCVRVLTYVTDNRAELEHHISHRGVKGAHSIPGDSLVITESTITPIWAESVDTVIEGKA